MLNAQDAIIAMLKFSPIFTVVSTVIILSKLLKTVMPFGRTEKVNVHDVFFIAKMSKVRLFRIRD